MHNNDDVKKLHSIFERAGFILQMQIFSARVYIYLINNQPLQIHSDIHSVTSAGTQTHTQTHTHTYIYIYIYMCVHVYAQSPPKDPHFCTLSCLCVLFRCENKGERFNSKNICSIEKLFLNMSMFAQFVSNNGRYLL